MISFIEAKRVNAQVIDSIPNVLNIPKSLDRTALYFYDKLNNIQSNKAELYTSAQSQVMELLNLGDLILDDIDVQYVDRMEFDAFLLYSILFQTQKGVYVPAHLYVPHGEGPFPAVLNSHGHWPNGKSGEIVQKTAQLLARNGYVCLNIDAWGAGERGTNHTHEYHGGSLGASLLDLGIPLMGMQVADNIRAIDVLQSLPYVDSSRIGATGASGGGNQTFWISILDDRVKAAVPVVSIGTFGSYILNSNCVCELLPSGLKYFETKDLIFSIAPKPIKILSAIRDGNAAFSVNEMLKTFQAAKVAYEDHSDNFCYDVFDEKHDYTEDMRISMLEWFDKHFHKKRSEVDKRFTKVKVSALQVLKNKAIKDSVTTIVEYVKKQAQVIKDEMLSSNSIPRKQKVDELIEIINVKPDKVESVHYLPIENNYERIIITTDQGKLIPVIMKKGPPSNRVLKVYFSSKGNKEFFSKQIDISFGRGESLVMVDLFGLGERSSLQADKIDGQLPRFHTLSRSAHWLGESILSVWISEIETVIECLNQEFPSYSLEIVADRETAIAALMHSVLYESTISYNLTDLPYSYVPIDKNKPMESTSEAINMSIHTKGIIRWGDLQLLLALAPEKLKVNTMIDLSGDRIQIEERVTIASEIRKLQEILHH